MTHPDTVNRRDCSTCGDPIDDRPDGECVKFTDYAKLAAWRERWEPVLRALLEQHTAICAHVDALSSRRSTAEPDRDLMDAYARVQSANAAVFRTVEAAKYEGPASLD